MPRYFFNVRDGADLSRDPEGQEFADVAAAHREAVNSNREMLSEGLLHGGKVNHRLIEITDEDGRVVDTVGAEEVLLQGGKLRSYSDDVTKTAPVTKPRQ